MLRKIAILTVLTVLAMTATMAADSASAALNIGTFGKLGLSEEEFNSSIRSSNAWNDAKHSKDDFFKFYDSLSSMILGLDKGEVDEIDFPTIIGEYVLKMRPDFKVSCIVPVWPSDYVFGFIKGNTALKDKFDEALTSIKNDGTLEYLQVHFLSGGENVEFSEFDGAETVKIGVTGDIPPVDYVNPDGKPAGFNIAILSEIARRLKINVKLVHIDAGARASALASGRVDAVFWFHALNNNDQLFDIPEDVIISKPYYSWSAYLHLSRR